MAGPRPWGCPWKGPRRGWGERRASRLPGAGPGACRYPGKGRSDVLQQPGVEPGWPASAAGAAVAVPVLRLGCGTPPRADPFNNAGVKFLGLL